MKCLITGVAGFIGSSLADYLLSQNATVVGIDSFVNYYSRQIKEANLCDAIKHPNFTLIEQDLINLDLNPIVSKVDYVFHLAAQAGVRSSWGEQFHAYTQNNILATQVLLEAVKDKKNIKKIVNASSSSVYGDAEKYPTLETDLPKPKSPYGVTKLSAEHLMVLYDRQFGIPTVSLRYFTVYGPRQRPDMAFHRFIRAGLTKQPVTIYGTGTQVRDFTYIQDILNANLSVATTPTPSGLVLNIGGGAEVSVNEVLDLISAQIGDLFINKLPPQAGDVLKTKADIDLAKKTINYQPKFSLNDGIGLQVEWLKNLIKQGL